MSNALHFWGSIIYNLFFINNCRHYHKSCLIIISKTRLAWLRPRPSPCSLIICNYFSNLSWSLSSRYYAPISDCRAPSFSSPPWQQSPCSLEYSYYQRPRGKPWVISTRCFTPRVWSMLDVPVERRQKNIIVSQPPSLQPGTLIKLEKQTRPVLSLV